MVFMISIPFHFSALSPSLSGKKLHPSRQLSQLSIPFSTNP